MDPGVWNILYVYIIVCKFNEQSMNKGWVLSPQTKGAASTSCDVQSFLTWLIIFICVLQNSSVLSGLFQPCYIINVLKAKLTNINKPRLRISLALMQQKSKLMDKYWSAPTQSKPTQLNSTEWRVIKAIGVSEYIAQSKTKIEDN